MQAIISFKTFASSQAAFRASFPRGGDPQPGQLGWDSTLGMRGMLSAGRGSGQVRSCDQSPLLGGQPSRTLPWPPPAIRVDFGVCVEGGQGWEQAGEEGEAGMPERGHMAFLLCLTPWCQQQPLFSWESFPVLALAPVWECATMEATFPWSPLNLAADGGCGMENTAVFIPWAVRAGSIPVVRRRRRFWHLFGGCPILGSARLSPCSLPSSASGASLQLRLC